MRNAYERKYPGELLSPFAVAEYGSVGIFAKAASQSGLAALDRRKYILEHGPFSGASGSVEFDITGDAKWPMAISKVTAKDCKKM